MNLCQYILQWRTNKPPRHTESEPDYYHCQVRPQPPPRCWRPPAPCWPAPTWMWGRRPPVLQFPSQPEHHSQGEAEREEEEVITWPSSPGEGGVSSTFAYLTNVFSLGWENLRKFAGALAIKLRAMIFYYSRLIWSEWNRILLYITIQFDWS